MLCWLLAVHEQMCTVHTIGVEARLPTGSCIPRLLVNWPACADRSQQELYCSLMTTRHSPRWCLLIQTHYHVTTPLLPHMHAPTHTHRVYREMYTGRGLRHYGSMLEAWKLHSTSSSVALCPSDRATHKHCLFAEVCR